MELESVMLWRDTTTLGLFEGLPWMFTLACMHRSIQHSTVVYNTVYNTARTGDLTFRPRSYCVQ